MLRLKKKVYFAITMALLFFGILVYYFVFTTKGSSAVARVALDSYFEPGDIEVKAIDGSFSDTLTFQNIELKDLYGLPEGSVLKIQKLDIKINSLSPEGLFIEIFNGKLVLGDSEPILISGTYDNATFDLNVYSRQVNVRSVFDLFAQATLLKKISGEIRDIDIDITGNLYEPVLKGKFNLQKLSHNGFSLMNCPGEISLALKDIKEAIKIFGEVSISEGKITSRDTVIELKPSKFIFKGDPKNPGLNVKGASNIERTKINIQVAGSIDKPEFKLASDPPLPQGKLLIMLATGKSWKGAEAGLQTGSVSPDLAADFLDYFVFGGTGSKLAKQLGISEVSLKFDANTRGVGIKKDITEKVEASYNIEQPQVGAADQNMVTQKVGAGYKITDNISVEGEKEIKQQDAAQTQEPTQADDRVLLKYKTKF